MTIKETGGLTYTLGSIEQGHADNIDMMSSGDAATAAVARLNRDLMNALEKWLDGERIRKADAADVMIAAMHGVTTVAGTILSNIPDASSRDDVFAALREHMLKVFDAMGHAVRVEMDRQ